MPDLVLGHPVEFVVDTLPADSTPADRLRTMFEGMVEDINNSAGRWSDAQTETFRLIDRLVVFRENKYHGTRMTRSYMAQSERTFYWVDIEYIGWDPRPRRPTAYFHDAWHVRQFVRDGQPPNDPEVLIDREQDAMREQLAVAAVLGCDSALIDFLTDYSQNRQKIRDRLSQGVGFAPVIEPHFLVLD